MTAQVNLCQCLSSWAPDTAPMERIGSDALDRVLLRQPDNVSMLNLRALLFIRKGRYEDALTVADHILALDQNWSAPLLARTASLAKLQRNAEAEKDLPRLLAMEDDAQSQAVAAMVQFGLGHDEAASSAARRAATGLTRLERSQPESGTAPLILAAAEARLGHADRARTALADFQQAVPAVHSVAQLKAWLKPNSPVPDTPAFFDALVRAGLPP